MSVKVQSATDPGLTVSKDRCEPGSVNIPVCKWPKTAEKPSDPQSIATEVVNAFNKALADGDTKAIANLFLEDGYWRDHLGLTWDLHTFKGREKIQDFLANGCPLTNIELDTSTDFRSPKITPFDFKGDVEGVQFFFTFSTKTGRGQGVARLSERDGQWKIFTLFTTLREIKGHEEPLYHRRSKGVQHGGRANRKNWKERREATINFEGKEPTVLIVGMLSSLPIKSSELCLTTIRCWPGRTHSRRTTADAGRRHVDHRS